MLDQSSVRRLQDVAGPGPQHLNRLQWGWEEQNFGEQVGLAEKKLGL